LKEGHKTPYCCFSFYQVFRGLKVMDKQILDEYQKQLNQWHQQLGSWQKKFFRIWLDSVPNWKNQETLKHTLENTINFQEEVIKTYLDSQEKANQILLENQRQFWEEYFEILRNTPTPNVEESD
jgi:hypothetical protein